jgi:hypothetical protein
MTLYDATVYGNPCAKSSPGCMLTRLQQQALLVMYNANLKGHANERKDTFMFFIMFSFMPCVFFALKMRSFFAHGIVGPKTSSTKAAVHLGLNEIMSSIKTFVSSRTLKCT